MYCNSQNRMRMRMYHCFTDIKLHQRFAPMVSGPDRATDMKPHVVSLDALTNKSSRQPIARFRGVLDIDLQSVSVPIPTTSFEMHPMMARSMCSQMLDLNCPIIILPQLSTKPRAPT